MVQWHAGDGKYDTAAYRFAFNKIVAFDCPNPSIKNFTEKRSYDISAEDLPPEQTLLSIYFPCLWAVLKSQSKIRSCFAWTGIWAMAQKLLFFFLPWVAITIHRICVCRGCGDWPQSLSCCKWAKEGRDSLNSAHEQRNWQSGKLVCVYQWSVQITFPWRRQNTIWFSLTKKNRGLTFILVVKEMLKNQLVSQSFCWVGRHCWLSHSLHSKSNYHTIISTSFMLQ